MNPDRIGFTLIETLLVVALIAILGASTTPFLSNFMLRNHTETARNMTLSSLRKAQQYALQSKQGAVWGVCLSGGNTVRFYSGSCATPTYAENYTVPASVSISGLSNVTFDSLRGAPSAALSVVISSAIGTQTITMNAAGLIEAAP